MKALFFRNGINELSEIMHGAERIYFGIRPYGFHAGNMLPSMIYPYMLAKELEKKGKSPAFTIYVFLNDWEQDGFEHYDREAPFDVAPRFTTFQYTKCETSGAAITDVWEPIIMDGLRTLQRFFPRIRLEAIRNSTMKRDPWMKEVVLKTVADPSIVKQALFESTGKKVKPETRYCAAICPKCHTARTLTKIASGRVNVYCPLCAETFEGVYEDFDYWLYHKPLALPRIKSFNIDVCLTGGDHFNEGDYKTRALLFRNYGIDMTLPYTLYTNVLHGRDGRPMGKSRKNTEIPSFEELISRVEPFMDSPIIEFDGYPS